MSMILRSLFAFVVLPAALAGCDRGTVELSVADAPVDDADRVVVQFTGVVLEHSNGKTEEFTFSPPKSVDLLAQTGGLSARLLDGDSVEDGTYTALRFTVNATGAGTDSFVDESGGARRALVIDPADEARLRITDDFNVQRMKRVTLVVDFDLRKSVLVPETESSPYRLRPALRLIETRNAGAVEGTVGASHVNAEGCRPAVYLFEGHDAAPDDEGSPAPPFASSRVQASGVSFTYHIAFLPAGDYTAAFTCEAAADDPETDDDTAFAGDTINVTVEAGVTAGADFP